MTPMLSAVLPLQLVCQLVVPGVEHFSQNSNANIATVNQLASPKGLTKLPESFVTHPDIVARAENFTQNPSANVVRRDSSSGKNMVSTIAAAVRLQLVCQILALGAQQNLTQKFMSHNDPVNFTTPVNVTKLPKGYVAYDQIGVAYKIYEVNATWNAARKLCFSEGSQLALIDTPEKMEYIRSQKKHGNNIHVGIQRFDGSWVSSSDGSLMVFLATWATGEPNSTPNCVSINWSLDGLENVFCTEENHYVCELRIPGIDKTLAIDPR